MERNKSYAERLSRKSSVADLMEVEKMEKAETSLFRRPSVFQDEANVGDEDPRRSMGAEPTSVASGKEMLWSEGADDGASVNSADDGFFRKPNEKEESENNNNNIINNINNNNDSVIDVNDKS